MSSNEPWAQLVSTTDATSEPVTITKDKFTMGRAKSSDLSLAGNKLVSGTHCFLERDSCGKVWLQDTSTNGCLVNLKQKVSRMKVELRHGDEIHLVYRKSDPSLNVAYLYQDLAELEQEELDATQEYEASDLDTSDGSDVAEPTSESMRTDNIPASGLKRQAEESVTEESQPVLKKQKHSETEQLPSASDTRQTSKPVTFQHDRVPDTGQDTMATETAMEVTDTEVKYVKSQPSSSEGNTSQKGGHSKTDEMQKAKATECGAEKEGQMVTSEKTEEVEVKEGQSEVKEGQSEAASKEKGDAGKDALEETLICIICQEILHDCVSLQPCMHTFCGGCYSDWMERSKECPSCRVKVERINKNHIVNNLVEAYLNENPDKKRPEEDLKELDAKNKITKDMLYTKKKKDSGSSSSESSSSYDSTDSDDGGVVLPPTGFPTFGGLTGMGTTWGTTTYIGTYTPPKTVCRQCPEFKAPTTAPTTTSPLTKAVAAVGNAITSAIGVFTGNNSTSSTAAATANPVPTTTSAIPGPSKSAGTSGSAAIDSSSQPPGGRPSGEEEPQPSTSGAGHHDDAQPSTSGEAGASKKSLPDEKVMPTAPPHVCTPTQNHILCQCCLQPMPDRRTERVLRPHEVPPVQCDICFRSFCHAYWGCQKAECQGCFGKFRDMNFGKKCLVRLILENQYESEVFGNYLESEGLSVRDVLQECCRRWETGKYTCSNQGTTKMITPNSPVCYTCGLRVFKELAYQYRKDIPKADLPAAVTSRPDCYWGKNCRTQKCKLHHAVRFNHICDQTRTT